MKVLLMFKDRDFDTDMKLPSNSSSIIQDLELELLFSAMANGNAFIFEVSKMAILSSLTDIYDITYRQDILKDCLKNQEVVLEFFNIGISAIEGKKKCSYGLFSKYPGSILYSSIEMMQMFMNHFKMLRRIADDHSETFESEGFSAFFAMLKEELDEEYFRTVQNHIKELKFRNGILISAELGVGNNGINYVLRKRHDVKRSWWRLIFPPKQPGYSFCIHERDESGARILSELRDRGINLVANALAQSADHILSFFNTLCIELAFYLGCLNLHAQLTHMDMPLCFPSAVSPDERRHSFEGLYDVCLALKRKEKVVGNDINADGKELVMITGANQGGKSTFLRSIGVSQLMMQCGMFTPAESFSSNICSGLFTHYKREEDSSMNSGKLDEELCRMSDIADNLTSNSLVLFNESFAATNEREGSEIARQIVTALLEKNIKVFFVTHLFEFAHGFWCGEHENSLYLQPERQANGERTFKIIEGIPSQTSYGEDVYRNIFTMDA